MLLGLTPYQLIMARGWGHGMNGSSCDATALVGGLGGTILRSEGRLFYSQKKGKGI